MDCEQIEQKLHLIIGELYDGLNDLADKIRGNESRGSVADRCEQLAWDICKHWPTCFDAHEQYVPPGESQQA
jgi:hypothetical protein